MSSVLKIRPKRLIRPAEQLIMDNLFYSVIGPIFTILLIKLLVKSQTNSSFHSITGLLKFPSNFIYIQIFFIFLFDDQI